MGELDVVAAGKINLHLPPITIVIGVAGALYALWSPTILIWIASGYATPPINDAERFGLKMFATMTAIMGVVGYLIARQCWIHLRRPDRSTAKRVAIIVSVLVSGWMHSYVRSHSLMPKPDGVWGTAAELAFFFGLILACCLFYRHVLKRIAERAFPSPGPESHA